ncbi:MAG: glycoside hydrolase family 31 protein [Clostridia bacterium]|nr:glycoside hydrolase family 31 protein [Clostridia bacterium]
MKAKSFLRLLALLLALMMVLPVMIACGGGETPDAGTTTDGNGDNNDKPEEKKNYVTSEEMKYLYLATKNISTYSIARSEATMNLVKSTCMELADVILNTTGAQIPIIDSSATQLTQPEIIIGIKGTVGREEGEKLAEDYKIGKSDYVIKVVGDDLIVVGGSREAVKSAVDNLLFRVFYRDAEKQIFAIEKNFEYVYRIDAEENDQGVTVNRQEKNYLNFSLNYGSENEVFARLSYAGNGAWRVQTKLYYSAPYDDLAGASQLLDTDLEQTAMTRAEDLTYSKDGDNVKVSAADGSYAVLETKDFAISFYSKSGKLTKRIVDIDHARDEMLDWVIGVSVELTEGEEIFGTGTRFNKANQRGSVLDIYTKACWDSANGSNVAIPLFTSSTGAGVFVNRYEHMVADIGKADANVLRIDMTDAVGVVDCYVFATDKVAEALNAYAFVSGYVDQPEDWTYGMLVCRKEEFSSIDGIQETLKMMEAYALEWNGIILEGWKVYNRETQEQLKMLCDYVHSLGKKVICYVHVGDFPDDNGDKQDAYLTYFEWDESRGKLSPTAVQFLPNYEALPKDPDVKGTRRSYMDLTDEAAVEWFFGEYWEQLVDEIGVDGVKVDLGELMIDTIGQLVYDDGRATQGSHHWYPTYFANLLYKAVENKADGGMLYISGGGIGIQNASYVWGGDQTRYLNRLNRQLCALLSAGLSGVPLMSLELGGSAYYESKNGVVDDIDKEAVVFLRALEFGAFTVSMETAGSVRQAYDFAKENADYAYVTDAYRAYVKLHEYLTPYIDEYTAIASTSGVPVVRHMIINYQGDKNVYGLNNQYMFGDAFLVAPELAGKDNRKVYLPEGEWMDLNTGETIKVGAAGKTITVKDISMTEIPVYYNVKSSSKTAANLIDGIREIFDYLNTIEIPD